MFPRSHGHSFGHSRWGAVRMGANRPLETCAGGLERSGCAYQRGLRRARGSSAGPCGIEAVRHLIQTVYLTRHVVQARVILCL